MGGFFLSAIPQRSCQPCGPASQDRQHSRKYNWRGNKIFPTKYDTYGLQTEEDPAQRAYCLRIAARHGTQVPGQKSAEQEIGRTKQPEAAIEISVGVTLRAEAEAHVVHGLLHRDALRRRRLEFQESEGMPSGKQDQDKRGDAVQQRSGHRCAPSLLEFS